MPTIPILSRRGVPSVPGSPRVSTAGRPDIAAVGAFGEELTDFAIIQQNRLDDAYVTNALADIDDEARNEVGAILSTKGEAALGSLDNHTKWWDKTTKRYTEKRLKTERQKKNFGQIVNRYRSSSLNAVQRHQATEQRNFEIAGATKLANGLAQEAVVNPFPVDERDLAWKSKYAAAITAQVALGVDEGIAREKILADSYTARLRAMIDQDARRAVDFLEQWKDKIGIQAYTSLKNTMRVGIENQQFNEEYAKLSLTPAGSLEAYDNRRDVIDEMEVPLAVKNRLKTQNNADRSGWAQGEATETQNLRRTGADNFYAALRAGDHSGANGILASFGPEFSEQEKLIMQNQATTVDAPLVSDKYIKRALAVKVYKGEMTEEELLSNKQISELTAEDIDWLRSRILQIEKADEENRPFGYKGAIKALESAFRAGYPARAFQKDTDRAIAWLVFQDEVLGEIQNEESWKKRRLSQREIYAIGKELFIARHGIRTWLLDIGEPNKILSDIDIAINKALDPLKKDQEIEELMSPEDPFATEPRGVVEQKPIKLPGISPEIVSRIEKILREDKRAFIVNEDTVRAFYEDNKDFIDARLK